VLGDRRWCVIEGDSLREMAGMPDGFVQAIVTDPPYGIGYKSKHGGLKHKTVANDERPFVWWMCHAYRVLAEGSACVVFCRWDVQDVFQLCLEVAGFHVTGQIVWDRVVPNMKGDLHGGVAPQHDVAWFATKGRFTFPGGPAGRLRSVIRAQKPHVSELLHPTEKPVELMIELVSKVTPRGGVVLDPFCGAGSTGEAALRSGLRFIGIELEARHAAVARQRLADAEPMFGESEHSERPDGEIRKLF
jgi:DNA modification methylase